MLKRKITFHKMQCILNDPENDVLVMVKNKKGELETLYHGSPITISSLRDQFVSTFDDEITKEWSSEPDSWNESHIWSKSQPDYLSPSETDPQTMKNVNWIPPWHKGK